ncbi:MAG: APC family permease [Planctomycetota bacterium]|jgi:amino acid transporter
MAAPKKELSLFDSTCIIVGIIIGAGIYENAPTIASCMGSPIRTFGIWLAGGLFALTGALCYAELATTYPRQGGDYVYLTRAYGPWAGYMFGFSQIIIIRPGDIALMAFIFARYANTLYPFPMANIVYASAIVIILSIINIIGVKQGKWTQNILTIIKAAGLLVIIVAAIFAPSPTTNNEPVETTLPGLQLALILVLFTYGGWNEMAYVAAEVKNFKRNIVRALIVGTIAVTLLYLLINAAFIYTLGFKNMASSSAVATDTIAAVFPNIAGKLIGILICISTLGAANGLIFTGSRISYAMGSEHALFKPLGKWSPKLGTPVWALILQSCLALLIVLVAGSFIDTLIYTAPVFWLFLMATSISIFILRRKDPLSPRPYKITGYPLTTIIFCASSAFMVYNCISFAYANKPKSLIIACITLLAGIVLYLITNFSRRPKS